MKKRRGYTAAALCALAVLLATLVAVSAFGIACEAVKSRISDFNAPGYTDIPPAEKTPENGAERPTEGTAGPGPGATGFPEAADSAGAGWNGPERLLPEPSAEELEMLACVIYSEAGGDACSDLARQYVGDVVLNRVADPRFPDTLEGVLLQKGQYGRFHWTGVVWPERAQHAGEAAAVARARDAARALLSGEHSELYGAGYVWQAEFRQGSDVVYLDGIYFGR